MTRLRPQRNIWAVRDKDGLVHMASVMRFFDDANESLISALHVATACHPAVTMVANPQRLPWAGSHNLPNVDMHDAMTSPGSPIAAKLRFTVVAWNVHEAPTCLRCVAMGGLD
jgi:poly-beta-hydroxyalkanoate depolymerase